MFVKASLFQSDEVADHTGFFVGFFLPLGLGSIIALDIEGGEVPGELHITFAYCPDVQGLDDLSIARGIDLLLSVANLQEPLDGVIGGFGRFNASSSSDGKDVIYANVDVPGLDRFRSMLCSILCGAGIEPATDHGYTPHITLAYIDTTDDMPIHRWPEVMPLTIDSLTIAIGDRKATAKFSGKPAVSTIPEASVDYHSEVVE